MGTLAGAGSSTAGITWVATPCVAVVAVRACLLLLRLQLFCASAVVPCVSSSSFAVLLADELRTSSIDGRAPQRARVPSLSARRRSGSLGFDPWSGKSPSSHVDGRVPQRAQFGRLPSRWISSSSPCCWTVPSPAPRASCAVPACACSAVLGRARGVVLGVGRRWCVSALCPSRSVPLNRARDVSLGIGP